MMLSDREIGERLWSTRLPTAQQLKISPKPAISCMQPASIDLTLHHIIKIESGSPDIWRPLQWSPVDIAGYDHFHGDERHGVTQTGYPLMPGQVVLASTAERLHIPVDLSARVEGKSSLGRLFITAHKTAGFIDPGFVGDITLEISNDSPVVQYLVSGMRICQISFTQLSSPALRPYGSEGLGSHYHGQTGPTESAA